MEPDIDGYHRNRMVHMKDDIKPIGKLILLEIDLRQLLLGKEPRS